MNFNLTLIGQMGTLLVFWWFVHKYIWPIIADTIEKRNAKIAEGLSMADKAKFSLENAQKEAKDLLDDAKNQASEIINRAQKEANQLVANAKEQAKHAAEHEHKLAFEQLQQEINKARSNLRNDLADLVFEGAKKVIGREVSVADHHRLINELSEKI